MSIYGKLYGKPHKNPYQILYQALFRPIKSSRRILCNPIKRNYMGLVRAGIIYGATPMTPFCRMILPYNRISPV